MILADLQKNIVERLGKVNVDSPLAESKLILSHLLNCSFGSLMMRLDETVDSKFVDQVDLIIQERLTDRPIQYILGSTEFFGIDIEVGEGVLIPRPETEILVEKALQLYPNSQGDILELCTGSGAIVLALQAELTTVCDIYTVEIDDASFAFAKKNIDRYQGKFPERPINLRQGDLFAPVKGQQFSMIVTNPPYVTDAEFAEMEPVVTEYEPKLALTADDNGLAVIRKIAAEAPNYLTDDGILICEMGSSQGTVAKAIFEGTFSDVSIIQDYTNRDRFILAKK